MSKLIILRGNSGSGKSTVALELAKHAKNKTAIVDADHYRVNMLFPKPIVKDDLAALMSHNVRYCLEHGYDVLWDNIFYANDRNKQYLDSFFKDIHPADNFIFTFDVSFEETARRHQTRPKSKDFDTNLMKEWYHPVEKLGYGFEHLIPEANSLKETVSFIQNVTGV